MKRVKSFTCWTDYPFESLGDLTYQVAPIRNVKVIGYDGDKYARVELPNGDVDEIKAGYLYSIPTMCGTKKVVNRRKLERMLGAPQFKSFKR